ncbi:type VI secretion system baseplate subunit TssG [Pseudomonas gingeri]|uniref:Type VI secretion system baseplate subunit TssG n=1 Tax=Pseudomonas gingeri TaxID=117681 RepID=A0A7Y8BPR2_9PSED|nr:type VI secretion system baseplate subunit TssG [Pseudomonas gingeri]NWB83416.1 type VI secretion system baseplate subunit TssG [Pseudomonas gingeri]
MDATFGATTAVLNALTCTIREYTLFQAVRVVITRLREAYPDLDEDSLYEKLEFQANPSFAFPGSDVDKVTFFEEAGSLRACLRFNLMALSGASSPLPMFYAEQVLQETETGQATRAFLDVFHHRLQRLILPVWQKYRYYKRFRHGATDPLSEQLYALAGLGGEDIRQAEELDWKRLLPYLGLLSQRAHCAALIEAVLRYYFNRVEITIEQCVERTLMIVPDQRNRLSLANSSLGHDLVLGTCVSDCSGKFRVHIRNLDWLGFHEFLPGGSNHPILNALVRFTLRDPLNFDVRLVLRETQRRDLHLGAENSCRLGWSSWLEPEKSDGTVTVDHTFY